MARAFMVNDAAVIPAASDRGDAAVVGAQDADFRTNDLPSLPPLDSGPSSRHWPEDKSPVRQDFGGRGPPKSVPKTVPEQSPKGKSSGLSRLSVVEAGELNRPLDSDSSTGKVLDSDGKSAIFPRTTPVPKGPKKALTIPKNRTGSGRSKRNC